MICTFCLCTAHNNFWLREPSRFVALASARIVEPIHHTNSNGSSYVEHPDGSIIPVDGLWICLSILSIDGRKPTSVAHAMRILGSYESGEELKIEIMRDERKRTITLEIPDRRQSANWPPMAPQAEIKMKEKIVVVDDRL